MPRRLRIAALALPLACTPTGPLEVSSSTGEPNTTGATDTLEPTTGGSSTLEPPGDPSTGDVSTDAPTGEPPGADSSTTAPPGTSTLEPDTSTGEPLGCADLPLCEGFEADAVGGPPGPQWTVTSPNCAGLGALAVADDQARTGAHSLRVDGGGGYCDHVFIAHTAAIEALGPQVYGRFHVRFTDPLGDGHVTFLTLRDTADAGGKDLRMGGQSKIYMWNRESDDATLPSLSPAGIDQSRAPAPGQWSCVEFMIDQDAAQLRTWIDGDEVPGLVVDAEPTADIDQQWHGKPDWKPALADIKFGWESYAGQKMVVHFDDIALANERIHCE